MTDDEILEAAKAEVAGGKKVDDRVWFSTELFENGPCGCVLGLACYNKFALIWMEDGEDKYLELGRTSEWLDGVHEGFSDIDLNHPEVASHLGSLSGEDRQQFQAGYAFGQRARKELIGG